MKTTISLFLLIFGLSICVLAKSKEESNLVGYWKLVKAQTNGKSNPDIMMDRTMEYKEDGFFEGKIFLNGEDRPYNQGKFFLANDSTMICIHSGPDNKFSPVSFTYNFQVRNDSLHLYGFYFNGVQDKPGLLQMIHINEWWVKPTALYKKK